MNRNLLLLIICLSFSVSAIGQITATTKDGKTVLLYDNGTWKYQEQTQSTLQYPSGSSDCSKWIETVVDKMDGSSTTAAKQPIIVSDESKKKGFYILLQKGPESTVILSIDAIGAGPCVDEGDKINILFRDGSRMVLFADGKFNCDANSTVYFGGVFGRDDQLRDLTKKEIETLRVWTRNSFVERNFSSTQSKTFCNVIRCLYESK